MAAGVEVQKIEESDTASEKGFGKLSWVKLDLEMWEDFTGADKRSPTGKVQGEGRGQRESTGQAKKEQVAWADTQDVFGRHGLNQLNPKGSSETPYEI